MIKRKVAPLATGIGPQFISVISSSAKTGAVGVLLIGLFPLFNWLINERLFETVHDFDLSSMNPVTAISFILLGICVFSLLSSTSKQKVFLSNTRLVLAVMVTAAAFLKLLTFFTGHNLDLDNLVFIYNADSSSMAPNTAISLFLMGLSFILVGKKSKRRLQPFVVLTLGVLAIASLAFVGHTYKIMSLYQLHNQPPMPASTAFTFVILCISFLFSQPTAEPMATIFSDTIGGLIARRLLPAALTLPFFLGVAVFWADRHSYLDLSSGMTLFVLSNSGIFVALTWWTARQLYRLDSETKYLMDLLAKKAMIDGLTGLWNQNHFDQRLAEEMAIFSRKARPFSCIIADVDHFKIVNDTYGHETGDDVLRKIGRAFMDICRQEDIVCRYGGEEFVIILPETAEAGALLLAERMRIVISELIFESDAKKFQVTCSFGVAQAKSEMDSVVKAADIALYRAKNAGRNRIEVNRNVPEPQTKVA